MTASHSAAPRPHQALPGKPLAGKASVPGDKSISHRALIFGALAVGETRVSGLLEGEDVLRTAAAMRAMGAEAERLPDGSWRVRGVGVGGFAEPADVLDMGNAGTGARLVMGLVASHAMTAIFTGDASLRRRPMGRVIEPLSLMGARFIGRSGGRLPLAVVGAQQPLPISYTLPVASAQVKSALLLAGLNAPGITSVIEPEPTRDHTENLLRHFGAKVEVHDDERGRVITLAGQPELRPADIDVPGDPSSAAFPLVAALIVPGSEITITGVGMNPLRTGLFDTLLDMGADLTFSNRREQGGEPVADITARHSRLKGITVPPERAPSMIDEYPILFVAAACAEGKTIVRGAKELRVKESDRLAAMARALAANGVALEELEDGLIITGNGQAPQGSALVGGASVATELDHRIAMSALVLGLAAKNGVAVDDVGMIDTSFPGFVALIQGLGGNLTPKTA
ncbi:3-phosphoshikimate 1-carboxyvinyltransferase [Ferrovibrio sp.]|uniref:3-phosphoshikimate 1-carboxyvinyltransferase n=1 Tax=Ferrovibrio sp. TaxID=1917215 RepID=UPI0025BD7000|nr:3-phosphoshikimate 1-carboxyvinyltransferase [Ferrovibrio sp.]MBX3453572.1 3-phosphoshikimate 1-carboxyvinyltransferase [Ferrovibrio sp.]